MQTKLLMTLALALLSQTGLAQSVRTWTNPECATGNCEVKAMRLYFTKYNQKGSSGNSIFAEIEGSNRDVLRKYAFVQYLRGCIFEENNKGERKIVPREFMGRSGQPFKHTDWEIDSAGDRDPIYWSRPGGFDEMRGFEIPRNAGYRTAREGGSSWAGKISNLKAPKIFVSDMPTWTQFSAKPDLSWIATNSSLDFKICLHRIEDIEAKVSDPRYVAPNPLTCMTWSSNYIYDKTKFRNVEQTTIHPFCR